MGHGAPAEIGERRKADDSYAGERNGGASSFYSST
jgi:hypothetical protein